MISTMNNLLGPWGPTGVLLGSPDPSSTSGVSGVNGLLLPVDPTTPVLTQIPPKTPSGVPDPTDGQTPVLAMNAEPTFLGVCARQYPAKSQRFPYLSSDLTSE